MGVTYEEFITAEGYIYTVSGKKFKFMDTDPSAVTLCDAANSIANICRFVGHVSEFYSVAQHSILVSRLLIELGYEDLAYTGAFHDIAEAYFGDVSRPLKKLLERFPEYVRMRSDVERNLANIFKYTYPFPPEILMADNLALSIEARKLMPLEFQPELDHPYSDTLLHLFGDFDCLSPTAAKGRFLSYVVYLEKNFC